MNNNKENLIADAKLLLELQCPELSDVWLEGYEGGLAQQDEAVNPYPQGSSEFANWQEGWWAGFYGEEPLYTYEGAVNPLAGEKLVATKQTFAQLLQAKGKHIKFALQQRYEQHWKLAVDIGAALFVGVAAYQLVDVLE